MGSRIACALPMFTVYLLFMLAELQWSVHAMIQIRLKIVVLQVSDIYASKVVKWFKDMLDFFMSLDMFCRMYKICTNIL